MQINNKKATMIPTHEQILTKRCRLRYPDESDIPHIWSASRTPGFNNGMAWEPPSEISELNEPLQRNQDNWKSGHAYNWTVEGRDSREFIGRISIRREQNDSEWSIGYWIHPTQQNRGYATEAAEAIVLFGFSRLHATIITAAHVTWNHASGQVLQRIGMSRVRTNPKGFRKQGKWVEEYEYEIRADTSLVCNN